MRRDGHGDMRRGRQDERQDCCMKREFCVLKLRTTIIVIKEDEKKIKTRIT